LRLTPLLLPYDDTHFALRGSDDFDPDGCFKGRRWAGSHVPRIVALWYLTQSKWYWKSAAFFARQPIRVGAGRGIVGVIGRFASKDVDGETDVAARKEMLQQFEYRLG
jgi:hypothetical protein